MTIAQSNAQAVKPLLAVYQALGPKAYLQTASEYVSSHFISSDAEPKRVDCMCDVC